MSVSVCLFVSVDSVRWHISKTTGPNFSRLSAHVTRAVVRFFSDFSATYYVFPLLCMTSCFHIMGPMACGVGTIYASAVLEQVVINFQRIRQGAPHGLTLSLHTVAALAANCAPGP